MFFVLKLLEVTGLRPGELFRYKWGDDDCFHEQRCSPFLWEDVNLVYMGRTIQDISSRADNSADANRQGTQVLAEPSFLLQLEWKYGKNRTTGEIIPSSLSSQPIETSHHCAVRWLLVLGMWLNVFEPDSDAALRKIIFDGEDVLPRGSRLRIRREWCSVPVILCDRSPLIEIVGTKPTFPHHINVIAMDAARGRRILQFLADILGWDSIQFYDYRRTFATVAKNNFPGNQLKLLMGHRREHSSTLASTYVADHCPIDQSAFAAGGRWMATALRSEDAQAAAGRSHGLAAPAVPSLVFNNAYVAKALEKVETRRNVVMADKAVAARIKRLAIDLLDEQDWTRHLSEQQITLVESL